MSTTEYKPGPGFLVIPVNVRYGSVLFDGGSGGGMGASSGIIRRAGGDVLYHQDSPALLARQLRELADRIEQDGIPQSDFTRRSA